MTKFSKALEQAERDRRFQQRHSETGVSDTAPSAASGPEAGPLAPAPAGIENGNPPAQTERQAAGERTLPTRPSVPRPAPSRPIPPSDGDESDSGAGVDDHLVSLLHPNAFEAEQYRALRHAVELAHRRAGLSVIAISSPAVGDGKTTTAINLAGALAQAPEVRVLLIDADLRRPSLASHLGLVGTAEPTLADLILDPLLSLDDVACSRPPFNLTVIPAGAPSPNSYELFKAPRLGEILAEARTRFDYVILDTPPLLHVLDSRVIGRWVDGYLIVVACHQTSRKLLEEALGVMDPEKVVGLVFNGDEGAVAGYRHYAYGHTPRRSVQKASRLSRILRPRSPRRR